MLCVGLSAALILGRCRRRVVLCDDGQPRNAAAQATHGFFTRDGVPPRELLRLGREQLSAYDVEVVELTAVDVSHERDHFRVVLSDGSDRLGRKLLLATGLRDQLPELEGLERFYGSSVFRCPYCDGWEVRERKLAAYGRGKGAIELALALTTWSGDIVLCTDGWARLSAPEELALVAHRIAVHPDRIARLEGASSLERIVFEGGGVLEREAMFLHVPTEQRSPLAARLGCNFSHRGMIRTGHLQQAGPAGLYVAGDAAGDVRLVAVAVAEGARAAYDINKTLREEESARRLAEAERCPK